MFLLSKITKLTILLFCLKKIIIFILKWQTYRLHIFVYCVKNVLAQIVDQPRENEFFGAK